MSPTASSSSSSSSSKASSSACASTTGQADPQAALKWYGHEETAKTAASYIMHLFHCPNIPAASATSSARPPLANFVAYALYRTQLPPSVTTCALLLLSRLKARYPSARGSSGHRLFISAFMMSSKMNCDDTYSNKSWAIVAQNMFPLQEINQMEREMLGYLEWNVDVGLEQMEELQHTLDGVFNAFRLPAAASLSSSSAAHSVASPSDAAPRYAHQHQQQHQLPTPASSTASSPLAPTSAAAAHSAGHSPAFQAHAGPSSSGSSSHPPQHGGAPVEPSYPSPPYSPCASLDFGASAASTPCSSNASPYECSTPPNGHAPAAGPPAAHHPPTAAAVAKRSSGFECWSADVHVV